jgi:hypothetical protein
MREVELTVMVEAFVMLFESVATGSARTSPSGVSAIVYRGDVPVVSTSVMELPLHVIGAEQVAVTLTLDELALPVWLSESTPNGDE